MDKIKDVSAKAGSVAQSSGSSSGTAPAQGNMVAPGSGGSANISRDAFEANSKAYFDNLHAKEKTNMDKIKDVSAKAGSVAQSSGSSSGTAPAPWNMVAPGSGGSANISRDAFEANSKAYFDNLHAKEKENK